MKIDFTHIAIEIIDGCNYYCDFCIRNANRGIKNPLSEEELENWLKKATNGTKLKLLSLTGGEPFLHKNFLNLIKIADKYSENITITTNASIINDDIMMYLEGKENYNFIISLDSSTAELHNEIRGHKLAFDKVNKFTEICNKKKIPFFINITVGPNNYKTTYNTIKKALKLGAENVSVALIKPEGRGLKNISNEILTSVGFQVKQAQKDFYPFDILFSDPLSHIFSPEESIKRKYHFCAAGSNVLHIQNNGDILMCTSSQEVLGNINSLSNFDNLHADSRMESIRRRESITGICGSCNFLFSCGGCRCRASKVSSILGTDYLCPLSYISESKENTAILNRLQNIESSHDNVAMININDINTFINKEDISAYHSIILTPFVLEYGNYEELVKNIGTNTKSGQYIYIHDKSNFKIPLLSDMLPIVKNGKMIYCHSRLSIFNFMKKLKLKNIEVIYFDADGNFLIKGQVL